MNSPLVIAIITLAFTFIGGLLVIIYQNLNKKALTNSDCIKDAERRIDSVKDTYATKGELKDYKGEHILEHNKQDQRYEKLDKKLDQIIRMLLEKRNEE